MRRISLRWSAAIAALLALVWFLGSDSRGPHSATRPATGPEPRAEGEVHPPLQPVLAPSLSRLEHGEPSVADALPAHDDPRPSDSVLVRGAAVRIDENGLEHTGDDGELALGWRSPAGFVRRTVDVRGGQWSVEIPEKTRLTIERLSLAGYPVSIDPPKVTVPDSRFVLLRGRDMQQVLVHVVDADSASDLSGVEVFRAGSRSEPGQQHPGRRPRAAALVTGATSPVLVDPGGVRYGSRAEYWVRAPGHAWGSILLDHAAGGERTLELPVAAAIDVHVDRGSRVLGSHVQLARDPAPPDGSQYAVLQLDDADVVSFDDVAPGSYRVSVGRGEGHYRLTFDEVPVRVEPHERASVVLGGQPPATPQRVRASGTLVIPTAWSRDHVRMKFEAQGGSEAWENDPIVIPLTDLQPLGAGGERFFWEVELPAAGNYGLTVVPLYTRHLLSVPADGLRDCTVAVPPPADVEVRVVDAGSLEEIEVDRLSWHPPRIEGFFTVPRLDALRSADSVRCTFRSPAGEVRVASGHRSLFSGRMPPAFPVAPGKNEIELLVERRYGARISFVDGEAVIPFDENWETLTVHAVGHAGRVVRERDGVLWFDRTGLYELKTTSHGSDESTDLSGYAPIDRTLFEVRESEDLDEVTDVRVELRRL